eukprot:Gb_37141 [translate_table: standard]
MDPQLAELVMLHKQLATKKVALEEGYQELPKVVDGNQRESKEVILHQHNGEKVFEIMATGRAQASLDPPIYPLKSQVSKSPKEEEPLTVTPPSEAQSTLAPPMSQLEKQVPMLPKEEVVPGPSQDIQFLLSPAQTEEQPAPTHQEQVERLLKSVEPLLSHIETFTRGS